MSEHSPLVKQMLSSPTRTREEEHDLAVRMKGGDKLARQLLIEGNLCYAVRFATCSKHFGVPIDELVSEAMTGLTKAADKYDPERGTRFITYAAHWMRAYMTLYVLRNWRMVNPSKGEKQAKMFFRLRREMSQSLTVTGDFETSLDIVCTYFEVDRDRAKRMLQILTNRDASLDAPIGSLDDGDMTLYDTIPCKIMGPDEVVERRSEEQDAKAKVQEMLTRLSPRERKILELRHLCDREDALTLDELGKMFGVSRERIRQVEAKLLRKLRVYMRGKSRRLPESLPRQQEGSVKALVPRARRHDRPALCRVA